MGSIRIRNEKLFFEFRYLGVRCREQTRLPDNKQNRKKLEMVLERIEAEITLGSFDYAKYFPNSSLLPKIHEAETKLKPGYTKTPRFNNFVDEWLEEQSISWRASTAQGYQDMLRLRLRPYFGQKEVNSITKADILKFRSEIGKSSNGKLKAKTINKHIKLLKMILTEAADRYHFTPQHLNIKPLKEEKVHIEPFSLEEVNLILNHIRKDWRDYVLVRFFTGMRSGEIDGLKWEYVDFNRNEILVRETYSKGEFQYTKNDGSQREIEMSSLVRKALLVRFENRKKDSELVFHTNTLQPIDLTNFLNRVWRPILAYLQLKYRKPYQTRHTAATLWLAAGENPNWIAKQMGHSTTNMLFSVYARYVPNLTRKDGSAMERLLAANVAGFHDGIDKTYEVKSDNKTDLNEFTDFPDKDTVFWDQFLPESHSHHSNAHTGG